MPVHPTPDPSNIAPVSPDGLDDHSVLNFATEPDYLHSIWDYRLDFQYQPDGRPFPVVTPDFEFARDFYKVLSFIEGRLPAPDLPLPVFKLESLPNGQWRLQDTLDVSKFWFSLWCAMNMLIERFPLGAQPRKPPHLTLFQKLAQSYGQTYPVCADYRIVKYPLSCMDRDPVAWVAALNRFVEDFRQGVEDSAFKATLRAYRRPALENYRSLGVCRTFATLPVK